MTLTCTHVVRGYECDGYNHVNNAVYLNYLEYARMEFLKGIGFDYRGMREKGYGVVISRIAIDYRLPSSLDDELLIETTPTQRRVTGGVFRQRVLRAGELVCEAEVTWVTVNSSGRPARLPPELDFPELAPDYDPSGTR